MKSKIVSIVVTIAILLSSVTTCVPVLAAENESPSGLGSFVERMYTVALGRDADESGKDNWVTMLQAGSHDGAGIAREFILGEEFKIRGLSNEDYVDVLYSTFFDRPADAEGRNLWVTILEGGNSREYVLSQFVNLDEFKLLCESYGINRGVMLDTGKSVNPGVTKFAERLYELVLGRMADSSGLYSWTYFMTYEIETPESVATQFFNSQEYLMKNTEGETFVGDLYKVFMGREADFAGLKFWTDCLIIGMTRDNLISEFAASEEFKAIMASYGLGGDAPPTAPEPPTEPESPTEPELPTAPEPPTEPELPTEPEPIPHVHSYSVEIVAATCTEDGYENQICACGDEITTVIPATGHTIGEWEVVTPATEMSVGIEAKRCTFCGVYFESREIPQLPHTHEYTIKIKAATCTEDGYENQICACDDVITTVIPATGHTAGEWEVQIPATEEATGVEVQKCTVCGEVADSREIPKLEHVHNYTIEKRLATCLKDGYETKTCGCGDVVTTVLTAPGHTAGEWVVKTATTDLAPGIEIKKCTVCQVVLDSREIAQLPHTHTYTIETKSPTCTEDGYETQICRCEDVITTVIPATGHTASKWEVVEEATDLASGLEVKKCTVCGEVVESREIEQLPHTHTYSIETKEPTCTEAGYERTICYCGDITEQTDIPATGHTLGEWVVVEEATEKFYGKKEQSCTTCREVVNTETIEKLPHKHKYNITVIEELYCTKVGYILRRCSCGIEKEYYIVPDGHKEGDWEVDTEATDLAPGLEVKKCTVCGEVLESREIEQLPHIHSYESEIKKATCTEDGYERTICYCGDITEQTDFPATGHDIGDWEVDTEATDLAPGLEVRKCNNCDEVMESREIEQLPHTHSYTTKTDLPTCTETGCETKTCYCGDVISTELPATGHTAGDWEVDTEATDLASGLEVKKCTNCDEVLESREIEKLPHTHSYVADTKAVTCTEDGYEQKICACGDVIEKTVIPSTGHVEGDWVTVRVQDVGVTGLKEVHCVKCDEVLDSEESEMLMTDGVDSVYYITVRNDDGTKSEIPVVGHYNEEEAQEMLTLVNEYRMSKDLTALDMNRDGMMSYTDLRAAETSYLWDHTRPSGWGLDFSENIAYAPYDIYGNPVSVETIFNAWIESYGHRKNIEAYRARNSTAISVFYRKTPVKNVDGEIIKYLYTAYWVETFY